jgi:hypothetical protein
MCDKMECSKAFRGTAFFRKNNFPDGMAYFFEGKVIPCACGGKSWFRPDGFLQYVECTPAEIQPGNVEAGQ